MKKKNDDPRNQDTYIIELRRLIALAHKSFLDRKNMKISYTRKQLLNALANLEWYLQNKECYLDFPTESLIDNSGGLHIDLLTEEGLTPATR